jgi:hypothetical protein
MKSFITWNKLREAEMEDVLHFFKTLWEDAHFKGVEAVEVRSYERTNVPNGTTTLIECSTRRKQEPSSYGVWWEISIHRTPGVTDTVIERVLNPEEVDLDAHYV